MYTSHKHSINFRNECSKYFYPVKSESTSRFDFNRFLIKCFKSSQIPLDSNVERKTYLNKFSAYFVANRYRRINSDRYATQRVYFTFYSPLVYFPIFLFSFPHCFSFAKARVINLHSSPHSRSLVSRFSLSLSLSFFYIYSFLFICEQFNFS